jgi:hypothetical protein
VLYRSTPGSPPWSNRARFARLLVRGDVATPRLSRARAPPKVPLAPLSRSAAGYRSRFFFQGSSMASQTVDSLLLQTQVDDTGLTEQTNVAAKALHIRRTQS